MAYIGLAPVGAPISANDIVDGALTSAKIADGSIISSKIADGNVITSKIKDLNVTTGKIAALNVTTAKIADGEVTTAKIANGEVTEVKMNASARKFPVNAANVATDAVETIKIKDLNVTTEKLAADSVLSSKIAPITDLQEDILITAAGAQTLNSNVTISVKENSVRYFTAATTSNICINIRGDDSTTLNSIMNIGNTITTAALITNGGTPQFVSNTQVDNVLVVPKVQGGEAITEGNANSTDIYTITVVKTADATFTMFLTQSQFA